MNESIFIGRLVRDPVTKDLEEGKERTSFTIAVDRDYKKQGEKFPETDFIYIIADGKQSEFVRKYFKKGDVIRVNASYRQYKPKGSNESKHFFRLNKANFVPGARKQETLETSHETPANDTYESNTNIGVADDDLPF